MLPRECFLLLVLLPPLSTAFSMLSAVPGETVVTPGDRVSLLCVVDGHYEWCRFYHPSNSFCDFEWKRLQNNISRQECGLADRVSVYGSGGVVTCLLLFR